MNVPVTEDYLTPRGFACDEPPGSLPEAPSQGGVEGIEVSGDDPHSGGGSGSMPRAGSRIIGALLVLVAEPRKGPLLVYLSCQTEYRVAFINGKLIISQSGG